MTNSNKDSDLYLTYLHHGRNMSLPVYLVNHMEEALLALANSATRGKSMTLRKHFGKEVWEAISDGKPSLAGICVVYLVANRRVPFEAMGIDPDTKHQMYALI